MPVMGIFDPITDPIKRTGTKIKDTTKDVGRAIREPLFGQDPGDVELPPEYLAAQDELNRLRQMRADQLASAQAARAAGQRTDIGASIEQAGQVAGRDAAQAAMARARGSVAGARGLGALGLRRSALTAGTQAGASAQSDILQRAGERADIADVQREESLFASLMQMEQQRAQQALLEEQVRAGMADPGLLGTLTGMAGAGLGAYFLGPQGAEIGGQVGYGLGEGISPYLR